MNKKIGIGLCSLLAITAITTGCGKEAKLDDNKTAVSLKGVKITATDYYNELKKSHISKLVDMIDHQLFDEKYPSNDEEGRFPRHGKNTVFPDSYSSAPASVPADHRQCHFSLPWVHLLITISPCRSVR